MNYEQHYFSYRYQGSSCGGKKNTAESQANKGKKNTADSQAAKGSCGGKKNTVQSQAAKGSLGGINNTPESQRNKGILGGHINTPEKQHIKALQCRSRGVVRTLINCLGSCSVSIHHHRATFL